MSTTIRNNPYFTVERYPAKTAGPVCRASATIARADTNEPVARLAVGSFSCDEADAQLDQAIAKRLSELEKPHDWGRDPTVFHMLQRYLQFKNEMYGMVGRAQTADPDIAELRRQEADTYQQVTLDKLRAEVNKLSESQLLELAEPTADQLARLDDPWVLDSLAAKKALCQLITRRTPAVQASYERLDRALNS